MAVYTLTTTNIHITNIYYKVQGIFSGFVSDMTQILFSELEILVTGVLTQPCFAAGLMSLVATSSVLP